MCMCVKHIKTNNNYFKLAQCTTHLDQQQLLLIGTVYNTASQRIVEKEVRLEKVGIHLEKWGKKKITQE